MIVDDLCAAFLTAGITVAADYGRGIDAEVIQADMRSAGVDKVKYILQVIETRPDFELMSSTLGKIKEGRAVMYSIGKRDSLAINGLQSWWTVLCNDGSGNVTRDILQPTDFGLLRFWHWRSVGGGLNNFADKFGNLFICNQLVDFAYN